MDVWILTRLHAWYHLGPRFAAWLDTWSLTRWLVVLWVVSLLWMALAVRLRKHDAGPDDSLSAIAFAAFLILAAGLALWLAWAVAPIALFLSPMTVGYYMLTRTARASRGGYSDGYR